MVLNRIKSWGDRHHPLILDFIRITLGIFILLKGYAFMINTSYLKMILQQQEWISLSPGLLSVIIGYIVFVHMAGGLLITLGILTRLCCLLQLPVIIGAIFMSNLFISPLNSVLWLAIITCFLLIVFMIAGSGPLSLDKFLKDINNK